MQTFRSIRAKYGIKEDEFMILFLGRLVGVKGVDKLIMAYAAHSGETAES